MASDYPKRSRHPAAGDTRRHPRHPSQDDQLAGLIRFCGLAYGFTEQEITEAVATAMNDREAAQTCFKTIANEIEKEQP
jgi:hypothetical protein